MTEQPLPDLADVVARADAVYERRLARRRESYRLARELGFNARVAHVLAACSEEMIRRLAAERDGSTHPVP